MTNPRMDLLDPYEAAQLGSLEMTVRGVVEGFLTGIHRSPFRGFSAEFAENRPYQPGDELRYVDWRMLARSDKLFVKQFEEETNLRSMLVLDASASMAWTGSETRLTKLDYGRRLAAALALILLKQRDAAGFIGFDEDVRTVIPARSKRGQWWRLLREISDLAVGKGTAAEPALRKVTDLLRRRGLVVFISDLLLDRELAGHAFQYLRHRGHQVVVFHLMDPAEMSLEGPPEARFEDPESGERVVARPRELKKAYGETVSRAILEWRMQCRRGGIAYHHVTTDTPLGYVLRRSAGRRERQGVIT